MSTPSQTFLDEFRTAMLAEHNIKRGQHNTPSLTLETTLNNQAQAWAEQLLAQDQLQHDANRGASGENLYWALQALPSNPPMSQDMIDLYLQYYPDFEPPQDFTGARLAEQAVNSWYSEVADYSYTTTESINGNAIGHFTQVVWKDSQTLGCGTAWQTLDDGARVSVYVVTRYQVAGNSVAMQYGESYEAARLRVYTANVLPAT